MTSEYDREVYEISISGIVKGCGTFGECIEELQRMRMHGAYFQDPGDSVVIRRLE